MTNLDITWLSLLPASCTHPLPMLAGFPCRQDRLYAELTEHVLWLSCPVLTAGPVLLFDFLAQAGHRRGLGDESGSESQWC